jgi:hypothetical protein
MGWAVKKVYHFDEAQWAAGYVVPHPTEGFEFEAIIFRPFTDRGLVSVLNWCAYLNGGGPRPSGIRARYRPEELRKPPKEPECCFERTAREQAEGLVLSAVSNKRRREALEDAERPKKMRKKKGPTKKRNQDDG